MCWKNKQTMKKKIVFILSIVFFYSCYNDNEEELYGPVSCDVSAITYTNDVLPIINTSCATAGCHVSGGTGSGDFTNYTELKAKVDNGSFENRVLIQKNMPPSTPLTDCELQILQAWVDNGALNN